MVIWILASVLAVVLVKYYTAMEMRKLEARLDAAKSDLEQYRKRLQDAQEVLFFFCKQKTAYEIRLRFMKELIEDLDMRLMRVESPEVKNEDHDRPYDGF